MTLSLAANSFERADDNFSEGISGFIYFPALLLILNLLSRTLISVSAVSSVSGRSSRVAFIYKQLP